MCLVVEDEWTEEALDKVAVWVGTGKSREGLEWREEQHGGEEQTEPTTCLR